MLPLIDLDRVSLVEVLLTSRDLWYSARPGEGPGTVLAVLEGAPASGLVDLLDQLPVGERARCFLPRYGMRIWQDDGTAITDVVLCFSCNTAIFRRGDVSETIDFNGDAAVSQKLLARLRSFDIGRDQIG